MGYKKDVDSSRLRIAEVKPRTKNQATAIQTLADYPLVFVQGPAGTGKTFLAIHTALQALKEEKVRKLFLTRPAVEADEEEMGFLPGDITEKMDPYLRPLYDAIDKLLVHKDITRTSDIITARDLLESGTIEITPLAYMRGRDLENCILVCDEAQNITKKQMLMLLTRAGHNCKMFIVGDDQQSDVKNANGFLHAIKVLPSSPIIGYAVLDENDIQRSRVVKEVLRLWDDQDYEMNSTDRPVTWLDALKR